MNALLHRTHLLFEETTESWIISPVFVVERVCCCFVDFITHAAPVLVLPNDVNRMGSLLGRREFLEISHGAYSLVEDRGTWAGIEA